MAFACVLDTPPLAFAAVLRVVVVIGFVLQKKSDISFDVPCSFFKHERLISL